MTWVWDMDLPASEKLVMLALADCANDDGECWPSIATLSRKTGASERTIQRAIQSFAERSLLRRVEVPGRGCRYYFNLRHIVTPDRPSPVTHRRQPPSQCHPTPDTVTPKPSMNHQEPSSDASHPQGAGTPAKPSRKAEPKAKPVIPDWMPADAWNGYLEMRKGIGKPATVRAIELMIAKLERWRADGHDPGGILDAATEHNWTGLYEPKEPRNGTQRPQAVRSGDQRGSDRRSTLARTIDEGLDFLG